jgi:hypothetical protein
MMSFASSCPAAFELVVCHQGPSGVVLVVLLALRWIGNLIAATSGRPRRDGAHLGSLAPSGDCTRSGGPLALGRNVGPACTRRHLGRVPPSRHQIAGLSCHSCAISHGKPCSPAVTRGSKDPQARPHTGLIDADSQADSAGSIPVTPLQCKFSSESLFAHSGGALPAFPCPFVPDLGTPASGVQPIGGLLSETQESSEAPASLTTPRVNLLAARCPFRP